MVSEEEKVDNQTINSNRESLILDQTSQRPAIKYDKLGNSIEPNAFNLHANFAYDPLRCIKGHLMKEKIAK